MSYLVANSRRQVFSWQGSFIYPVWHLFNHYPTKSGQKTHPYTFSLLKNFQYHQNNKSITCTCMYAAKDLKYMPNLFDVHVTVKVWNQYCFCIFHSTKHYFMVKWRKAHHRLGTSSNMWAAAWQNQKNDLCEKEDADQPGHLPSLISLRCPHEKPCAFSYHWVHSLRWAHRSFCWLHVKLWSNSTNGTEVQTNEHMNGWTKRRKL